VLWLITRLLSRMAILFGTIVVASIILFTLLAVLPGNPAQVALGVNASPAALKQTMAEFGTDRPLVIQYLSWFGNFLHGSFGRSYLTHAAIGPQIADRAQVTATLVLLGTAVAIVVAVPLGVAAAVMHRKKVGTLLSGITQFGMAIPSFIAAILLIDIFAVRLHWLPSGGWTPPGTDIGMFLRQISLPVLSLGLIEAALLSRYVRSATLNVLREDYMRTARAKGLTLGRAFLRHGVRNVAIPVVTVLGLEVAALLVGAIIIESVFVMPGLGGLLLDSVSNRDLLLVQGIVMILLAAVLVVNFITDAVYLLIDPRLRSRT
jgi:peptide/nickel transport system permease protein